MEIEKALDGVNLAPGQKQKLTTQVAELVKDRVRRGRARNEIAKSKQFTSTPLAAGASAIGGAVAEEVRRNVIGAATDNVRGQGLGLILAGSAVHWIGKKSGIVAQVGTAHCALGGAMLAASFHGGTQGADDEDPLCYALRVTTRKYKNDKKASK